MFEEPKRSPPSAHPLPGEDLLKSLKFGQNQPDFSRHSHSETLQRTVTSFKAPIAPLPECDQFHSFRSFREAKEIILQPSIRMTHTPLSDSIFARQLEEYLREHPLFFPAEHQVFVGTPHELSEHLTAFLNKQVVMPNDLRRSLHGRIMHAALQVAFVAETEEICVDISRRTHSWMRARGNAGERANEYLHYDMAPVFGLWAPYGNQTLSVLEHDIDKRMLTRFLAEGLNDRWINAMKDQYALYSAPIGSLLIGKGARLSYDLDSPPRRVSDPDILSIGKHYHCGSPWLHLVDQMKPSDTRLLARFFTRKLPNYFHRMT